MRGNTLWTTVWGILVLSAGVAQAEDAETRPEKWAQPVQLEGVPNLHKVSDALYRSGQPTAVGMRNLEKMGLRTVINLRNWHSDEDELAGTRLAYLRIRFDPFDPDEEEVLLFLKIMAEPKNHPVLVHCQHGSDRTGTMAALYRMVFQGWPREEALREMTEGELGFHAIWQNLLKFLRGLDLAALTEKARKP